MIFYDVWPNSIDCNIFAWCFRLKWHIWPQKKISINFSCPYMYFILNFIFLMLKLYFGKENPTPKTKSKSTPPSKEKKTLTTKKTSFDPTAGTVHLLSWIACCSSPLIHTTDGCCRRAHLPITCVHLATTVGLVAVSRMRKPLPSCIIPKEEDHCAAPSGSRQSYMRAPPDRP